MENAQAKAQGKPQRLYPYLSIDHNNRLKKHREVDASQSLDFLNIKFDTRRELREVCLKSFKEKLAHKALFQSRNSQLDCSQEEEDFQRVLMKKKTLNPEQLLRSSVDKNTKDWNNGHQHRSSSHYYKQSIKFLQEIRVSQPSTAQKFKTVSFDRNTIEDIRAKPRRNINKMLRKCDQLKEIYRHEAELINTVENTQEHPIRFYTEQIGHQVKESGSIRNKKKEIRLKMTIKNPPEQRESAQKKPTTEEPEYKTLDVRKYRSDTSAKQRMKYLLRKQLMKYELERVPHKIPKDNRHKQCRERDLVGPWQAQQSFSLSKQT